MQGGRELNVGPHHVSPQHSTFSREPSQFHYSLQMDGCVVVVVVAVVSRMCFYETRPRVMQLHVLKALKP
jgi:hypothetical protein